MLTLRCICEGLSDHETRQSLRFRLHGKEFFDDEGKHIASLAASSLAWELHGPSCGAREILVLEVESGVSILMTDGERFGPFDNVRVCGGAVRVGGDVFAQFSSDTNAWCHAASIHACDPITFE